MIEIPLLAGKRPGGDTYRPDGRQTSVCSAISSASSTSIPKYLVVHPSIVWQSKSWSYLWLGR